jgi:hypothetical protein
MSRDQSWRLGRTFTVATLILWIINQFADSFTLSVATIVVGLVALTLLWKGSPE